ncbi:MAG: ORF6N domain-containing protein [Bacteroidota bacterium]
MLLQKIESKIFHIRNQKVLLDFDLSILYEVENRSLKQAVKRNIDRFPIDFMFQLNRKEWLEVITNCDNLPQNVKFSPSLPMAFTEQGVAMLSSVLKSKKALDVNISIMRAFVFIRSLALTHGDLTEKIRELENRFNKQFKDISEAINYLLAKDQEEVNKVERNKIGFK